MTVYAVTEAPYEAKISALAKIVHEANRAFCEVTGDTSLVPWAETPEEIRESAIAGVKAIMEDETITPKELHDEWVKNKAAEGWVYGEEKDEEKKTHPCLVDYKLLPVPQRFKDSLFLSIVRSYVTFKEQENKKADPDE